VLPRLRQGCAAIAAKLKPHVEVRSNTVAMAVQTSRGRAVLRSRLDRPLAKVVFYKVWIVSRWREVLTIALFHANRCPVSNAKPFAFAPRATSRSHVARDNVNRIATVEVMMTKRPGSGTDDIPNS
jgi:hypothetical protein